MNYTKKDNVYATLFTVIISILVSCAPNNSRLIDGSSETPRSVQRAPQLRSFSQKTTTPDEKAQMLDKRDSILLEFSSLSQTSLNSAYDFDLGILGFGYNPEKGFQDDSPSLLLESNRNATQPVINMREVSKDPYSLFYPTNIYIGQSSFTTNSSTEITQSLSDYFSTTTSKTGASISVDLTKFIAKLSAKINSSYKKSLDLTSDDFHSVSLTFASQIILTQSLSLTIPSKKLRTPESDVDPSFSTNSFSKSASELISEYGPFVLKSYTSGGKVTINAAFGSKNSKNKSQINNETRLLINVASKGVFGTVSISGSQNDSTSIKRYKELKNEYSFSDFSATSIGGLPLNLASAFPISSSDAKSFSFPRIDLSAWSQSVNDRDVLVKINDSGLIPISELIPEINISKRVKDYIEKGIDYNPLNYKGEPIIVNKRDGYVYLGLISRFGDLFLLDKVKLPQMGYEWWLYYKLEDSPINVCHMESYRCEFIEQLQHYNIIDLTSSNNTIKPLIKYCKIKDTLASRSFTYILINNKYDRRKIALRILDAFCEESGLDDIDEVEYISNVHGYEIYAL